MKRISAVLAFGFISLNWTIAMQGEPAQTPVVVLQSLVLLVVATAPWSKE